MKAFPWIVTGLGLGFLVAWLVLVEPAPQYATGSDDVDDAADKTGHWGTKQRVSGAGSNIAGKVKEGIGRMTGDDDLAGEGVIDQAAGAIKEGAGQVAQAAGQTIHDLNI